MFLYPKALMLCPECEPVNLDKDSTSWIMGEVYRLKCVDYQSTDAYEISFQLHNWKYAKLEIISE